jgi:hypothetical protein
MVFNRQIRLKSRPVSMPRRDDFEIADAPLAQTKHGEVLDMTTMTSKEHSEAPLIKILAQLFRGFHYVVGISARQPGASGTKDIKNFPGSSVIGRCAQFSNQTRSFDGAFTFLNS